MDKTGRARQPGLHLLIAALVFQSLTPDLLDLALLSHSKTPGSESLSSYRVSIESEALRGSANAPDPTSISSKTTPFPDGEDEPSPDLCEPFWPDLCLARAQRRVGPAIPKPVMTRRPEIHADLHAYRSKSACTGELQGMDLNRSLCRFNC